MGNTVAFAGRMPYATGVDGVYAGGAGCHPASSAIGAAGHNAAHRILTDRILTDRILTGRILTGRILTGRRPR